MKETGSNSESGDYKYITSCQIRDWRFRGEDDKIMTTLFTCKYLWGGISPSDDIQELKWFDISELRSEMFMVEHQKLFSIFTSQK